MYIILKTRLKTHTKDIAVVLKIMLFCFVIVSAIMIIKYKPVYEVTIKENNLGYITNKEDFAKQIDELVSSRDEKYVDNISLNDTINYTLKLVARNTELNENKILEELKNDYTTTTYKYYVVALNNENKAFVDTIEDAEQVINEIKSEYSDEELDLQVLTQYTQNIEEIKTDTLEVAEATVKTTVEEIKQQELEEEARKNAIAVINGVNISTLPVTGTITSRYGVSSRIRVSTHTGLDIACSKGTDIKALASGTVTFAQYNGSYGNLVKIDHGNGVETWYGHCDKIYVSAGQVINASDVIAAVGSTGNSTGPHLHLEIRINGNTVNPQNYLYN